MLISANLNFLASFSLLTANAIMICVHGIQVMMQVITNPGCL